ncbi:acyltransferase [Nocardioides bigeumensis]|uniref:Acyltransferase n=1 Tax=Nocardioides bigeumensis TaxID=433657 RepID=A0ABN2XW06_9ACTN
MSTEAEQVPGAEPAVQLAPLFPVLDTLRAVGALAVLTTHTAFQSGDYLGHGYLGTLLSRLDIGVAIFFVLSGFLLSRSYLARAALRRPPQPVGRYALKRLLRIYPVYAVTVVLALLLIPENDGASAGDWLRSLLLLDTYASARLPQGLTQMWSLGVEVAFYALLPLLMLVAVGRGGPLRPLRVVGLLMLLTAVSAAWVLDIGHRMDELVAGAPLTWLPAFLTWFSVGIGFALAHVVLQQRPGPPRAALALRDLGRMPGACWAMALGLLLVAATPVAGPALLFVSTPSEALTKNLLYAFVAGLLVLPGVFAGPGAFSQVLSWPPLRHLGHISYSIFCLHLPVLHLVMGLTGYPLFGGHGFTIWLLTVLGSLVAAELAYRLVERPAMRFAHRREPPGRAPALEDAPMTHATTATTR